MADLSVRVRTNKTIYFHGDTIALTVRVTNTAAKTLYIVNTPLFAQRAGVIHVRIGEAALPDGVLYYAFVPKLRPLSPGRTAISRVQIGTPLHEPRIVGGIYSEVEQPIQGRVTLSVTVGYLRSPFKQRNIDPWQELAGKQLLSRAATTAVEVLPH